MRAPVADEPELPLDSPKPDDAAELRRALDTERQRANRAESERDSYRTQAGEAGRRLHTESTARVEAEATAIDNAITAAKNEADGAEAEYAGLIAEGKFAEAAKVQRKMASAEARVAQFEAKKEWLGQQKERMAAQPEQKPAADPFEQFVQAYPENVRSWIRDHPKFYSDQTYRGYVTGAANIAAAKGLKAGTSEYFRFVEERSAQDMGEKDVPAQSHTAAPAGDTEQQQEDSVAVESDRPAPPIPAGAAPEKPQPRAAGDGAMRSLNSIAARPTRSSAGAGAARARPTLSPTEAATAMSLAQSLEPRDEKGKPITSEADIYKWYYDNYNSPSSQRRLAKWYGGQGAA